MPKGPSMSFFVTSADGGWLRVNFQGSDPGAWISAGDVTQNP
jgi:hypothetical protein